MPKENDISTKYELLITTPDNPWNPYTHFSEWYECDTKELGYNTYQRLANLTYISNSESYENASRTIDQAMIDLIIIFEKLNSYIEANGEKSVLPHYMFAEQP